MQIEHVYCSKQEHNYVRQNVQHDEKLESWQDLILSRRNERKQAKELLMIFV